MPNLDGLDATRIIREVSPKIPVIAVSAYAYEKDKAAAIRKWNAMSFDQTHIILIY